TPPPAALPTHHFARCIPRSDPLQTKESCLPQPGIPPMDLLARVYWNAVLGALGGLVGWFLGGVLDTHTLASDWQHWLPAGALPAGAVGYFVVSSEALRDRSLVRFARLASHGLVLGILGGGLGDAAAEFLYRFLAAQTGGGGEALVVLTRGVGGLVLGLF